MGFRLANIGGRAALVAGEAYFDLEAASGGELGPDPMAALSDLSKLSDAAAALDRSQPTGPLAGAALGPPVPRPSKVFGVGLNYRTHAVEAGLPIPDSPLVFTKFPSCLAGPTAAVKMRSGHCDYEVELVVVIGPGGRDIAAADAWDHVAGLTAGQDISDRALQFESDPPQFSLGKSYDTFGPTGPVLVSPDALDDPNDLRLSTRVNGEVRQDDTTANMIFDVASLIAYLSGVATLATGDLIFTGTPHGVGGPQGKYLADGDVISTTIEGIGDMANRCVMVGGG